MVVEQHDYNDAQIIVCYLRQYCSIPSAAPPHRTTYWQRLCSSRNRLQPLIPPRPFTIQEISRIIQHSMRVSTHAQIMCVSTRVHVSAHVCPYSRNLVVGLGGRGRVVARLGGHTDT